MQCEICSEFEGLIYSKFEKKLWYIVRKFKFLNRNKDDKLMKFEEFSTISLLNPKIRNSWKVQKLIRE